MAESRARENFVRLAEARTTKLLRSLDVLANLSNKSNYSYDEKDVARIFSALRKKLRDVELRFELKGAKRSDDTFTLD